MPKQNIVLNNWIGGENRGVEEHVQPNELSRMYGFTHTDGTLRSSKGRVAYTFDCGHSTDPDQMYRYTAADGSRSTLIVAKKTGEEYIFLDCDDLTEPVTQHRPIHYVDDYNTFAKYSFQPFGDRLFFSRTNYTSDSQTLRHLYWWDGFSYYTGSVTVLTGSKTTVTGTSTANFPGVRCGDKIFIGTTATPAAWNGPYVIKEINQVITLADADGTDKFTVTYGGATTDPLDYNIDPSALTTAITGLTSVGSGNAVATGSAGGPYTIRFIGSLFNSDSLTAVTAAGIGCTATMSYTLTIDSNGPVVSGVPYIISRVHQAGLREPVCSAANWLTGATSGGSIADGTYLFAVTWYNSKTGHRSNPVYESVTLSGGNDNTVTVVRPNMYTTGNMPQADTWEVWRETTAGSGVLYLVASVLRDESGFSSDASVTITGSETAGTTALTEGRDEPPKGGALLAWNGYMWTWHVDAENTASNTWARGNYKHRLYWSAYGNPEAWNTQEQYGIITPADLADPYTGGMVQVGDAGNSIMDVAIEGGVAGNALYSNLLLMTKRGPFHRFTGSNHDNWVLHEGVVNSTCLSMFSQCKTGDLIAWWSQQGPVAKANSASTNEVINIYRKQFPEESRPYREVYNGKRSFMIHGTRWGEWFVWCHPETQSISTTSCSSLVLYHWPTGTWTSSGENDFGDGVTDFGTQHQLIQSLYTWPSGDAATYDETDSLYAVGSYAYGASSTATAWEIEAFTDSTKTYWYSTYGMACLAKTGFITVGDPYTPEKIIDLEFCFNKPVTQQTVTVTVYDAETGAALKTADTLTLAAGANTGRHVKKIHLGGIRARAFQIQISGSFTAQVVCYWIRATVTRGGQE